MKASPKCWQAEGELGRIHQPGCQGLWLPGVEAEGSNSLAEAGQRIPEEGTARRVTPCGKNHNCVFLTQLLNEGTLALPKLETQSLTSSLPISPSLSTPFRSHF